MYELPQCAHRDVVPDPKYLVDQGLGGLQMQKCTSSIAKQHTEQQSE
jgi:hypothetical protein